ncbi:MAG TPA: hypothetical protein VNX25_02255 [Verrucomicrobiae bacterium]|nr:hypothetical protein [Verrucomicrobiae bacterium]
MNRIRTALSRFSAADPAVRLRWMYVAAALLLLAVAFSAVRDRTAALERKRLQREREVAELMTLRQRFREVKSASDAAAGRLSGGRADDSPAKMVEETGIRGKSLQVRPLKGEDIPGFVEDVAEVRIDSLSANEAVNLLYRIEKGPRPATIKRASVRTRFDDPSRLDLVMTVSLLKPSAGAK